MNLYQLHLPSEVRIFEHNFRPTSVSSHAVVMDSVTMVDDVTIYCRGYYFLDRWLSVFVTFDDRLELKSDLKSAFPFALNCDITTPHYREGDSIFTTDLYIDVLVAKDGFTYKVRDLEDFQQAFARGLFGKGWYESARRETDWLIDILARKRFLDFLNRIAPFPDSGSIYALPAMQRCHIDEFNFRYHPAYPRWDTPPSILTSM